MKSRHNVLSGRLSVCVASDGVASSRLRSNSFQMREFASFNCQTGPSNRFASSSSNPKTARQAVAVSRSLTRSPASCVVSKTAAAPREDRGSISTSMLFTPVRLAAGPCDLPTPWRASLSRYNPPLALHSGYCAGKKRSPPPIQCREVNRLATPIRRSRRDGRREFDASVRRPSSESRFVGGRRRAPRVPSFRHHAPRQRQHVFSFQPNRRAISAQAIHQLRRALRERISQRTRNRIGLD